MANVPPNELISADYLGKDTETIEWNSFTLGQNKKLQEIAAAAEKVSTLLNANLAFVKAGVQTTGVLMKLAVSPALVLLVALADEIDKFVADFKGIGFYVIQVGQQNGLPDPVEWDKEYGVWKSVAIIMRPAEILTNMAKAGVLGTLEEFYSYGRETLLEGNIELTGPQRASYEIPMAGSTKSSWAAGGCVLQQHKTKSECVKAHGKDWYWFDTGYTALDPSGSPNPPKTDKLGSVDPLTGLPKLKPSEARASMASSMDDYLDKKRPEFSTSAQAGAIILMIGVADLTKNLATIADILSAFITFFGGEKQGVVAGFSKINNLILAALGQKNNPSLNVVNIKVEKVMRALGTDDNAEDLLAIGHGKGGKPEMNRGFGFKNENVFSVGDFVIGPKDVSGLINTLGYVSKVKEYDDDLATWDTLGFGTQELEITALSTSDAIRWRNSKGASITRVHYYKKTIIGVDTLFGESVETVVNHFKWAEELTEAQADGEDPLVTNKILLPGTVKNEEHLPQLFPAMPISESVTGTTSINSSADSNGMKLRSRIVGKIVVPPPEKKDAPPPNWESVSLEEILTPLDPFFTRLQGMTDGMRQIAKDVTAEIDEIIKYMNDKIKELEEINKALQAILTIFTTGIPATGVYALNIPIDVGGNEYIKRTILSAPNRPPDSLDFTMSMMIVYGGPGKALIELLVPPE